MSGLTLGLMSLDTLDLEVGGCTTRCWHISCHALASIGLFHCHPLSFVAYNNRQVLWGQVQQLLTLQVLSRSGTPREQSYAKRVLPVSPRCVTAVTTVTAKARLLPQT